MLLSAIRKVHNSIHSAVQQLRASVKGTAERNDPRLHQATEEQNMDVYRKVHGNDYNSGSRLLLQHLAAAVLR